MNKSLFAVLLVCAFAGLAYADSPSSAGPPSAGYLNNNEVDEAQKVIQLVKALQSLQEMEEANVQQQQGGGRRNTAKSQWGPFGRK